MKHGLRLVIALLSGGIAFAAPWTPWAVGTGSTTVVAGNITFTAGTSPAPVWTSGQQGNKAFYSTDAFNGMKISSLIELSYTLLNPPDPTGLSAPYLNVVATDGTDFVHLLLDAMPIPFGQQKHDFSTASYQANEGSGGLAGWNGTWKSYADVKDLTIAGGYSANPAAMTPIGGWTGLGADDGVVLAWGNRGGAANYANPVTITNVQVRSVPDSASTFALLSVGLLVLAAWRRRVA